MGNIDSRSKFNGGYLFVKTAAPFYYPGQTVYGKIYIRAEVPMNPADLEIFVKGKEKAKFKYHEGHGKERNTERAYISKKLIEFRGKCFTF